MSCMKKLISLLMVVCFWSGTVTLGGTHTYEQEAECMGVFGEDTVQVEIDYASAQYNEEGTTCYDILNVEELASAWGMVPEKVREMKFVALPVQEENVELYGASPMGLFSRIEIQNVRALGQVCLNKIIAEQITQNMTSKTITKEIEISASTSHSYTTSVQSGINVEVSSISSAVGFDVVETLTITDRTVVELGPGESVEIVAVPLCSAYQFDIYQWKLLAGTNHVGNGYAYQVIGLCITTYEM